MIELIETKLDMCVGCNRCIRECPMEMANVTYRDETGNIKVKTDHTKCIGCGRCVATCKHGARKFKDDTTRFFDDLAAGIPISLIAAPSVQTNFLEHKKLFTYLKSKGVQKIYDASLGADICVWAHVRHIEQEASVPLITQPCPAIVLYCETYQHDLLNNLAPIHSPMACAAICMKNYDGITDRIAAITPCIAKAVEFADTQLIQYNITFDKLQQYLEEHNVELPIEETGFDHDESGLGVLFPQPGGLKENIEYCLGKKISISTTEGPHVYNKLDLYGKTPAELLPDIFDVLSCAEGCNVGPVVACEHNIFALDAVMSKKRTAVTDESRKKHCETLYQIYDKTFDRSLFMRKYRPIEGTRPLITEKDIEAAFELLGKTDDKKQHVDCGACGSDSCHNMARKIALGVNIPSNCIVKTTEDAKREHEENLNALAQVTYLEHLREADERSRIMLDSTPLGAQFWDKNINVIDCNQETLRLFSAPNKQDFLENFYSFFPVYQPDGNLSRTKAVEFIKKTFAGEYLRHEWICLTSDGAPLPLEVVLVRVDYKGDYLVAAYTRDLREQKRMMQEIDVSVEKLKSANQALVSAQLTTSAMLEANSQINVLFNSKLGVIDCNPSAVRLLGFETKEEMRAGFSNRIAECTPPFQSDGRVSRSFSELFGIAVQEGSFRFETELIIAGKRLNLNIELKNIPYENDFAVVAYVFNVTDIREQEKQLASARQQNELQLIKLQQVVQATNIGLWEIEIIGDDITNPASVFYWSDEFRRMLGFTDETDFPNVLESWSDRLHPEDKEGTLGYIVKYWKDKNSDVPFDKEHRLKKKNGEYSFFRAYGGILQDEHGTAIRIAGSLIDITDMKNILHETERQKIEADAASKAKSEFLSKMSHEIRTPMNAILGITEILLRNKSLGTETKEALDKIYSAGDLLLGIINDVLDLSKIEAEKLELIPIDYDVASLINDVTTLNMMRIGSKEIEFILSVDENLHAVLFGDQLRIKQILNNVLSNAIKYTIKGTVKLSVFAEEKQNDDVVLVFEVSDTGLGMTEEQVSQLFDAYSRFNVEANRTTEGTGLGMNITRNLVHMMEGTISVKSEVNKGSVFTVQLPQQKIGTATLGREIVENLQRFRANGTKQVKQAQMVFEQMPDVHVLVVDDVASNLYVAKGLLAPYGLTVDTADSGYAAIDKIKKGKTYDVIFMDHMMPKMDGIEATKIIRGLGYEAPIIALTANTVSGQSDVFLANGFDGFVSKPIDVRLLNATLTKFVKNRQSDSGVFSASEISQLTTDPGLIEIFLLDTPKTVEALEEFLKKGDTVDAEDIKMYIICVHGMKSALAYMGSLKLSALASKLEQAAKEKDTTTVAADTPVFISGLNALMKQFTANQ